jgi:probable HAF family extracellular repeat protein
MNDLGTLAGIDCFGKDVNASGQVVGISYAAGATAVHAFLYSGGQMLDLNNLIAPGSGFTLTEANGISNNRYITGIGTTSDGHEHAFLSDTDLGSSRAGRPVAAGDRGSMAGARVRPRASVH